MKKYHVTLTTNYTEVEYEDDLPEPVGFEELEQAIQGWIAQYEDRPEEDPTSFVVVMVPVKEN